VGILKKQFWIRVDASRQIGTGHVFRCLSLAESLKSNGAIVTFVCREFDGSLLSLIQRRGFKSIPLPAKLPKCPDTKSATFLKHGHWLQASQEEDASICLEVFRSGGVKPEDWIIVDHFALDATWESIIKNNTGCKIAVIDGQADRLHRADILIDPNLCQPKNKWVGLIQENTQLLMGFPYIPIHQSFFHAQAKARVRQVVKHILIAFGGVDEFDFTLTALQTLLSLSLKDISITVIVGANYSYLSSLKESCNQHPCVVLVVQAENVPDLMLEADLSIGAGGTMAWERCVLFLPALVASIADNQREQVSCLEAKSVAFNLGDDKKIFSQKLRENLMLLIEKPERLTEMSINAKKLVRNAGDFNWSAVLF
jgi:UDP-2,4-diacetamido-2,4,6-trideoxy-beta-L-altropyranose hydrolase